MRPKLRSSFCLGVEIPFNFFWNQQIRIMFLCRRTFFFLSCCFSFLCRSLNNLCFSMFCYSIDAWRWWSEKKPTRPPTVCSQSISAVAAVFAATRRDCRKLFGKGWSRGEAQTTGEKCGKFVNCGKQIKSTKTYDASYFRKVVNIFRLRMHGEIVVVHSNVNVSTPQLATRVIYSVPFRCCLLIQPDAKLILIDFTMEIKNLDEECHSCLRA